ncbi:MAG: hypothetical protein ACRD4F_00965 [Candidatus Angelobacter sp.]
MPKFLDLIRSNQVPAAVMRSAAKGALPVSPEEMIEIMVYLTRNPVFAQDAKITLAGWDPISLVEILASPSAPAEVLGYFWAEQNRRPVLMPALIENPAIGEELLMEAAAAAPREILTMLLASPRARNSSAIVESLSTNPSLTPQELSDVKGEAVSAQSERPEEPPQESDPEAEAAHQAWQEQHAPEISAEEGKAFELIGEDEQEPSTEPPDAAASAVEQLPVESSEEVKPPEAAPQGDAVEEVPVEASQTLAVAALASAGRVDPAPATAQKKLTMLQRLAKMSVAERVKTAFIGNREERAILIRDNARVVQNAVLSSPKLTDPEVEGFASAKNVHENVLREITRNRRFIKNYAVQRNLVSNPKTPLEISLTLVRNLMIYDLKALQRSRNVSETIRSIAQRLYREKATSGGKLKS